jgi:hypothetical protein
MKFVSTVTAMATLLLAGPVTGSLIAARGGSGQGEPGKQEKSRVDPETLRKYDRNGNGKLDPDEEAAMKADQAKERAAKERQEKQEKRR